MSPEDRDWLRAYHAALGSVEKADLGKRGKVGFHATRDKFAAQEPYGRLKAEVADLEKHHRDRMIGSPVYASDKDRRQEGSFRADVEARAARIEEMLG